MSYQSFAQVKSLPKWKICRWKIVEDSGLAKGDTRPPFHELVVKTSNYTHLGFKGEVQMRFFNNRLMQVWFTPANFLRYKKTLLKTQNTKLAVNNSASLGNTELLFARNYLGKDYILWSDETLAQENREWIETYA